MVVFRPRTRRLFALALALGFVTSAVVLASMLPSEHLGREGSPGAPRLGAALASPGALSPSVRSAALQVFYGVKATVPVGFDPVGVAYDSANQDLYVTNSRADSVSVIDGATQAVIKTVVVGFNPAGVAYDSNNSDIYVANFLQDDVSVINTTSNAVVANITVGLNPVGVAYDNATGYIYVTNQASNTTSIILGTTLTRNVTVGYKPVAAAYDWVDHQMYVANAGSDNVSVISTTDNVVITSVPVGKTPLAVAYDGGHVYVANEMSNNTTVIVAGVPPRTVDSIKVGGYPVGLAYNPAESIIVTANEASNNSTVISTVDNSIVGWVRVGSSPVGVAYDATNSYEYVTNAGSDNVSVIGTATRGPNPVTFTETGLPPGTAWSVTFNSTLLTGTTANLTASVFNGSYAFNVSAIADYLVSPIAGQVTMDGFPVNVAITFTLLTYGVTFSENGLPIGSLWGVSLGTTLINSTVVNLTFQVPNGTYLYSVTAVSGYNATPTSGSVTVAGKAQTITVTFTKGSTPASTTSPSSGIPFWLLLVIVVVVVAAVIGVILLLRHRRPPPSPTSTPAPAPLPAPTAPPGPSDGTGPASPPSP